MSDNCGAANPLSGVVNAHSNAAQQLQEAQGFKAVDPMQALDRGRMGVPVDMMQGQRPAEVDGFARSFQQGPKHPHMMPRPMHGPPPHMQHHMPQRQPGLQVDNMLAEFEQMNMDEKNQQAQFEQAYRSQHMHPAHVHHPHGPPSHMMSQHAMPGNAAWADEFHRQQHHPHPQHHADPQMAMLDRIYKETVQGPPQWAEQFQQQHFPQQSAMEEAWKASTDPGQAWANEFAEETKAEAVQKPTSGGGVDAAMVERLKNSDNPKFRNSKFIKFLDRVQKGELAFEDNKVVEVKPEQLEATQWANEFAEQDIQPAVAQTSSGDWATEFAQGENWAEQFGVDNADPTQQEWLDEWAKEYFGNENIKNFNVNDFAKQAEQKDAEYQFAQNNPFMEHADPFAEGIRLMKEGELKQAILAFEAAVQKNRENAEAWRYLGQAQAENETESQAIAALQTAVKVDPYNLDALMMLGVSYTNDLEEVRALNYLKTWLEQNPDYQNAAVKAKQESVRQYEQYYGDQSMGMDKHLHEQVTQMFHAALQVNPRDAELHTVLGVLYHLNNDFDKAIQAFQEAVKLRPDDPTLWNKLGATQANSARSDLAVDAYKKALALKPNYVRALANLAISYANQGMHEDASRTYLGTLKQNPDADHIWSYLRLSLSHMGRESLVELTHRKDVEAFRPYFQF